MYSCTELIKPEGNIRKEHTAEWELFRTPREVKVNKN